MAESFRLATVLYLQKPEVLASQAGPVTAALRARFPQLQVDLAGDPAAVVPGRRYDAVITPTLPWLPEALARLDGYRWIHFLSAGVEKIWAMPFRRDGVLLTKSSGVHGEPISEYVLGAMLYFAKRFDLFAEQSRGRLWQRAWLDELTGRTLLVLGLGHVGSMIAQRASLFGMRTTGVQRLPRPVAGVDRVVGPDQLDSELPVADYLAVCLPLTDATRGLLDQRRLERIKPGAVLLDVSRGGVVEAAAVIDALDSGRLRGAALDVFAQQPLPAASPLWGRSNVLITPHVSGTTPHYLERALGIFIDNARALERGDGPLTPVDPAVGY